jgi:hypothetical protein
MGIWTKICDWVEHKFKRCLKKLRNLNNSINIKLKASIKRDLENRKVGLYKDTKRMSKLRKKIRKSRKKLLKINQMIENYLKNKIGDERDDEGDKKKKC